MHFHRFSKFSNFQVFENFKVFIAQKIFNVPTLLHNFSILMVDFLFLTTLRVNGIFFDFLEPQKIIGKLPCTLYWLRGSPSLLPLLFSFVMRNAIQLMAGEVEKKQCSLFFCLWRLRRDHNPGTEETCTLRYRRNPIKSQYLVLLFPLTCSKPSFYVQNVIIFKLNTLILINSMNWRLLQ